MKQASLFWYKKNTFHRNFLKKNTPYLLRDTSGLLFDTQSKVFFCLSVCLLFRTNEICVISFINGSFVYFLCYEHHRLFLLKATVSKFERQQKFVHPPSFLFLRLVFSIQSSLNCLSVCLFVCPQKWKYREFFNKLQICVLVQEFAAPQTPRPLPPTRTTIWHWTRVRGGEVSQKVEVYVGVVGGSDERHYLLCASAKCSLAFKLLLLKKERPLTLWS